jgi:ATP-dependent Clp protease ATP-binding subunit ClpA
MIISPRKFGLHEVCHLARQKANQLGHRYVGPEHIYLVMSELSKLLRVKHSWPINAVKFQAKLLDQFGGANGCISTEALPFTPRVRKLINKLTSEAQGKPISIDALQKALINDDEGVLGAILRQK